MYSGFLNLKVRRDYLCPSFVVKNSVYKTFTAFTGNSFDIKAMLVVILKFILLQQPVSMISLQVTFDNNFYNKSKKR